VDIKDTKPTVLLLLLASRNVSTQLVCQLPHALTIQNAKLQNLQSQASPNEHLSSQKNTTHFHKDDKSLKIYLNVQTLM
jgi:hypothetical protein